MPTVFLAYWADPPPDFGIIGIFATYELAEAACRANARRPALIFVQERRVYPGDNSEGVNSWYSDGEGWRVDYGIDEYRVQGG